MNYSCINVQKAPSTYQEWLVCFSVLKSNAGASQHVSDLIESSCFHGDKYLMDAFYQQLTETINVMLDVRVNGFLQEINHCIEYNECEEMVRCLRSLDGRLEECLFYTRLKFLDSSVKSKLTKSIKQQISEFWEELMLFFEDKAASSGNSALEDVLYYANRMRLLRD